MHTPFNLITILGPTATGKTALAASLAQHIGGEIISADSRQIYRGMDIGTGKDLADYTVNNQAIPYHLIDIVPAGYRYNLYEYQRDCRAAFDDITARGLMPILCGGTGLYIEAVLKGYRMTQVPMNIELRNTLKNKSIEELKTILERYKRLHNTTDLETTKRAIRAIEIADYYSRHPATPDMWHKRLNPLVIGVLIDRDTRRKRITERLQQRLQQGMVDEVRRLIDNGLQPNELMYYGLEYKYVTMFIIGQLSYEQMFTQLETAIHQFAKRQMTWFRGMERRGCAIHWIDGLLPIQEKTNQIEQLLTSPQN